MAALILNRRRLNLACYVAVWVSLAGEANADVWHLHLEDRHAKPISSGWANGHVMPAAVEGNDLAQPAGAGNAPVVSREPPLIRGGGDELLEQPSRSEAWQGAEASSPNRDFSPEMLKKLMRPSFDFAAEWQAKTDDVGLASYDASVKFPTFPLFGPPPPFINVGFSYTNVDAPSALGLPADLYQTEFGLAWMRRLNDRWMTRLMAGTSFATDGENNTGDAWRFRGGAFAVYRRDPEWTWTFGAIALGRNDIPVIPAVGLIYQPNPGLRFDLIMPKPRVSVLLLDNGPRQQWGYIGAGLNGTTWGVQRADGVNDQLTYGDFRAVLGWESTPTPEPGMPFTRGRKIGAEIGYVFSRDFEFDDDGSKTRLDDTLMLRG